MNNRTVVSLLVIDDMRDRDSSYHRFVSIFNDISREEAHSIQAELVIAESPTDAVSEIQARKHDLVLLDQILSEGPWAESTDMVLRTIVDSKLPVVLVSMDFNSSTALRTMEHISYRASNPILGYFSLNEIFHSAGGTPNAGLIRDVYVRWLTAFGAALRLDLSFRPRRAQEDELTFLHLTDTHFGRQCRSGIIKSEQLDVADLAGALSRNQVLPDALIWSGDVSNSSLPSEFSHAINFFHELENEEILKIAAPTFVVPGNHDFCWPLMLSARVLKRHANSQPTDNAPAPSYEFDVQDAVVKGQEDLVDFGNEPFQQFCEKINGRRCNISDGFDFDSQYLHLGFAVLRLYEETHAVASRTGAIPGLAVSLEELEERAAEAVRRVKKSKCPPDTIIIVVTHRASHPLTAFRQSRDKLFRLLSDMHPVVLVCGHTHEPIVELIHRGGTRLLQITSAPHSEGADLDPLVSPCICAITLRRLTKSDPIVDVSFFSKQTTGWRPSSFSYGFKNSQWVSLK